MTYNSLDPKPITRRVGKYRIEAQPSALGPNVYRLLLDRTDDPRTARLDNVSGRDAAKAVVNFIGTQTPRVLDALYLDALEVDADMTALEEAVKVKAL